MRKIAMLNQKGGVGKTTSVVNAAAALARRGKKVLVADFDPQGHLTIHLGVEPEGIEKGTYDILTADATIAEAARQVRPNLFLLGANINLVGAESELVSVVGREIFFVQAIEEAGENYDYLIIDCPPSLGLLTLNCLAAAEEVIIPLQPHFLALQGLGKLLQTVNLVSARINPALKVTGVLFCMFDSRTSLSEEVRSDIEKFLASARDKDCPWQRAQVLPTPIRRNIKLAESPSYGKTIFEYEPDCHGAEDYRAAADFLEGCDPRSSLAAAADANNKVPIVSLPPQQRHQVQDTAQNPDR